MQRNHPVVSVSGIVVLLLVLSNAIVLKRGLVSDGSWYKLLYVTIPLLLISLLTFRKKIS